MRNNLTLPNPTTSGRIRKSPGRESPPVPPVGANRDFPEVTEYHIRVSHNSLLDVITQLMQSVEGSPKERK